jgi:flap endonuclease-1
MKEQKFENYFGRKVAVDASMHIYSFLVVIGRTSEQQGLTSESGELTSHLQGMFFRTARMLEAGMKPVFVFEGRPPDLKRAELAKRSSRREDATTELEAAKDAGDNEAIEKYSKRTVKVTRDHNEECKRLLHLMGVPVIEAPAEAEAQCSQMCIDGLVYGIATEDMDSLTFGCPVLLRHLMAPVSQKHSVVEFNFNQVLAQLELTKEQFVDLCILCGCDYCEKIPGIGPVSALKLIKKHGSLEGVIESLDKERYKLPEYYPYKEARKLFYEPDVIKAADMPPLRWSAPDTQGLIEFMVKEKSFSEERILAAIDRINAAKSKSTQGRLESFFGPVKVQQSTGAGAATKRKDVDNGKKGGGKGPLSKKGKAGGVGKKK